jgi:hypothetical protein
VKNAAVRLRLAAKRDVLHANIMVDRWGRNFRLTRTGKKQREASNSNRH